MTYQSIIPLLAAFCNLVLVAFVSSRPLRREVKGAFTLWGCAIVFWSVGQYFLLTLSIFEIHLALFWARVMYLGILFLPVTLVHLTMCIVDIDRPRFLLGMYLVYGGFAFANTTELFIERVWYSVDRGMWQVVPGPVFWAWAFSYVAVFLAILMLLNHRQRVPPLHRTRLDFLIAAQAVVVAAGTHDLLPVMGIANYPFTPVYVIPVGSVAALLYGIFVSYSLLQHQLLDVQVVLSRVAAKMVRLGFVWIGSLVLLLLFGWLAPAGSFPPFAFFAAFIVIVISTLGASIFFPKLFGEHSVGLERKLLGDRFEYHDRISAFLKRIPAFRTQAELLEELDDLLSGVIGISQHATLLKDEQSEAFLAVKPLPASLQMVQSLEGTSPMVRYFYNTDAAYLSLSLHHGGHLQHSLADEARYAIQGLGLEICLVFRAGEQVIGLLLLGPKKSGDSFTPRDLEFLTDLMHSLSLLINHSRLTNQLLLSEEMDLLGRMSQGIAHDLNNLLTPVSTYFQVLQEDGDSAELRDGLLPSASRNLETVRSFIRESLFFSDTRSLKLQNVAVAGLLRQCVELAHSQLKLKRLSTVVHGSDDLEIPADFILLKRAIGNLISNAIHACPPAGAIELSALCVKGINGRKVCRIDVQDNGQGMSQQHLKKIGNPYFTTKDTGDENRGFGLGLAICRKVVLLHGGRVRFFSKEGWGTVVRLEIPMDTAQKMHTTPASSLPAAPVAAQAVGLEQS